MCESFDTPQCNRQPFLSESGCDRGSVDIHQFDDLPYCSPINPTNPDVPPEIPDFPTSIPVPTYSCSCVNIRYKLDFKYDNKSSNEASFRAAGDCCEGNYISNFKLRIPCPVHSPENRRIKVGIEYGSGPNEVSASFLGANSSSCTIEALSPELHLNIPCPIQTKACVRLAPGVRIQRFDRSEVAYLNEDELAYSYHLTGGTWSPSDGGKRYACAKWSVEGPNGELVEFGKDGCNPNSEIKVWWSNVGIEVDGERISAKDIVGFTGLLNDDCKFSTLLSDINKGLAPSEWIVYGGGAGKLRIGIGYGEGNQSATAKLVDIDSSSCKLSIPSANINLNIPCPVKEKGPRKITGEIGYWKGPYSFSESYASVKNSCSIDLKKNVRLRLAIPCPVKEKGPRKISAKIKYGNGPSSVSDSYASIGSSCSINLKKNVRLNLNIPCPVKEKGPRKITAKIKYGDESSASASYASVGGACSINLKDVNLRLAIPCPVKEKGPRKITGEIKYGNGPYSFSKTYANVGNSCSIDIKDIGFNLYVPCPLKKPFLKIETSYWSSSSADFFISSSSSSSNCVKKIKIKTVFPKQKPIVIEPGECTNIDVQTYKKDGLFHYKIGVYYV